MKRQRRKLLILLAVLLQIGAVAALALHKEWVLNSGRDLWVQTAPVDPRDIFRGDYVRLDYLFSRLRKDQIDPALRDRGLRKGEEVFLAMRIDESGVAEALRLQLEKPDFPYLSGRVNREWPYRGYHRQRDSGKPVKQERFSVPVQLRYGIERYYVEQGRGHELEAIRGRRDDFQRAMLVELAVPERGQALIRGYRWSNLGIKTEILQQPERDAQDEGASIRLRLRLRNEGDQGLQFLLKPQGCSFELVPAGLAPADADILLEDRDAYCAEQKPEAHRLQPDQTLDIDFDFNKPHWWATQAGKKVPLGRLNWNYRWRLVYREGPVPGLRGRIVSRAFHGRGNLD